jgi:hypothetical protein
MNPNSMSLILTMKSVSRRMRNLMTQNLTIQNSWSLMTSANCRTIQSCHLS